MSTCPSFKSMVIVLLFVAAAVFVSVFIGPVFGMPDDLGPPPFGPSEEYQRAYSKGMGFMHSMNTAIAMGIIGLSAAVGCGIVTQIHRSFANRFLVSSMLIFASVLFGYLAGALSAISQVNKGASIPLMFELEINAQVQAILLQSLCWVGVTAGIWFAMLNVKLPEKLLRVLVWTLSGALVTGFLYIILCSVVFSYNNELQIVPPSLLHGVVWVMSFSASILISVYLLDRNSPRLLESELGQDVDVNKGK